MGKIGRYVMFFTRFASVAFSLELIVRPTMAMSKPMVALEAENPFYPYFLHRTLLHWHFSEDLDYFVVIADTTIGKVNISSKDFFEHVYGKRHLFSGPFTIYHCVREEGAFPRYFCSDTALEEDGSGAYLKYIDCSRLDMDDKQRCEDFVAIGKHYLRGDTPLGQNQRRAYNLFKRASKLGRFDAEAYIAIMHREGLGVNKSIALACEHMKIAVEAPNASPSATIMFLYACYLEEASTKNTAEALKWYRKSADLGYPNAIEKLSLNK